VLSAFSFPSLWQIVFVLVYALQLQLWAATAADGWTVEVYEFWTW
jgi:hypothetical protein